jgi:hypothetical protein
MQPTPVQSNAEPLDRMVFNVERRSISGATVPPYYRASRESWLNYLRDLQNQLDHAGAADEDLAALFTQEKADFTAAYPGDDIDALLSAP